MNEWGRVSDDQAEMLDTFAGHVKEIAKELGETGGPEISAIIRPSDSQYTVCTYVSVPSIRVDWDFGEIARKAGREKQRNFIKCRIKDALRDQIDLALEALDRL
jgi:hypothetical protein